MLQQTQVHAVIPYWERWMKKWPDLPALAAANPEEVIKLWEGLGYYRRARNLHQAARRITHEYQGRFPKNAAEMRRLPGIGRYTGGAIASIAFDQPEPILDGNVIRLLTRLFAIAGDPRSGPVNASLWHLAGTLIGEAHGMKTSAGGRTCADFNQALMELGALVCRPLSPLCKTCPVQRHCSAFQSNATDRFPEAAPSQRPESIVNYTFIIPRRNCVLVRQRPESGLNGGLWEFPNENVAADPRPRPEEVLERIIPGLRASLQPHGNLQHAITRFRIRVHIYQADPLSQSRPQTGSAIWADRPELDKRAFTAAHRRIINRFLSPPKA